MMRRHYLSCMSPVVSDSTKEQAGPVDVSKSCLQNSIYSMVGHLSIEFGTGVIGSVVNLPSHGLISVVRSEGWPLWYWMRVDVLETPFSFLASLQAPTDILSKTLLTSLPVRSYHDCLSGALGQMTACPFDPQIWPSV